MRGTQEMTTDNLPRTYATTVTEPKKRRGSSVMEMTLILRSQLEGTPLSRKIDGQDHKQMVESLLVILWRSSYQALIGCERVLYQQLGYQPIYKLKQIILVGTWSEHETLKFHCDFLP